MRPALSGLESPYAIVISNADPHLNGLETSDHTPKFVRFFPGLSSISGLNRMPKFRLSARPSVIDYWP